MDIEELAKKMREEALASETYWVRKTEELKLERAKKEAERKAEVERQTELAKRLYFNAGRWAGGARDKVARDAFEKVRLIG